MAAAPYTIRVSPGAEQDVKSLRPFDQKKIVEGMEAHLGWEPTKVSRSRIKQMVQPFWCQYRLRIEDFRVYYDVNQENRTVTVLRILEKGQAETRQEADHETN